MLNAFWNWFAIIITVASILGCWWLLHWTKGVSDRDGDDVGSTGHVWDNDIQELNHPLPKWWLHLFNITIVFSLVYMIIYPGFGNFPGILGWTQLSQYEAEVESAEAAQEPVYARFREMSPEQLMADAEAMEIGSRLFGNNCAMCHGSDGRGATGFPNLTDDDWIWGDTFDHVLTALNQGRLGAMPPWGAVLGEDGVAETVAYVQQLAGQDGVDEALAEKGQARYMTVCVACHGPDGTGNYALGAPNLTNDIWLYGGDTASLTTTLVEGRNGQMPAFPQLSDDRKRVLAAYVKSLSAD